jgi:hypothetical protein
VDFFLEDPLYDIFPVTIAFQEYKDMIFKMQLWNKQDINFIIGGITELFRPGFSKT